MYILKTKLWKPTQGSKHIISQNSDPNNAADCKESMDNESIGRNRSLGKILIFLFFYRVIFILFTHQQIHDIK